MAYLSTLKMLPFCFDTTDTTPTGDGTYHPIGLTWEELLQAIYRVKSFRLTVKALGPGGSDDVDYSELVKINGAPNESYLTCKVDRDHSGSASGGYHTVYFWLKYTEFTDGLVKTGDHYYPFFALAVYGYWFNITSFQNEEFNAPFGTFEFLDYSFPVFMPYAHAPWETFEGKLEIAEYWPYDPGDTASYPGKDGSGPVYDSTTGEQLRNPFNIVKRGDGTFYNPNHTP